MSRWSGAHQTHLERVEVEVLGRVERAVVLVFSGATARRLLFVRRLHVDVTRVHVHLQGEDSRKPNISRTDIALSRKMSSEHFCDAVVFQLKSHFVMLQKFQRDLDDTWMSRGRYSCPISTFSFSLAACGLMRSRCEAPRLLVLPLPAPPLCCRSGAKASEKPEGRGPAPPPGEESVPPPAGGNVLAGSVMNPAPADERNIKLKE